MNAMKNRFVKILRKLPIDKDDAIKQIKNELDSPLNYACRNLDKQMPEGNDLVHSFRVLENCMKIIAESRLEITSNGRLSLFYASLLHDIAKSDNEAIRKEIKDFLKEKCELFLSEESDHGIRSAHYIDKKRDMNEIEQRIRPYGLENSEVRSLLNIISFHNSGRMHPCFLPLKLQREELLLCLIFWLADITDAVSARARIPQSVKRKYRSDKDEARGRVNRALIMKNVIIWRAEDESPELEQAVNMANSELSQHRLLLQVFGLPNRITCLQRRKRTPKEDLHVSHDDIASANLCLDVSERPTPLVLSTNTLHELYEEMVEAFCRKRVTETVSSENCFGPVVLEVKDVENDEAEKTNIRSKTGKNFSLIKEYTETWLNPEPKEADKFYFGYTHGQRIWRYLYPHSGADMNILLGDARKFQQLEGKIDQFEHILRILKEGPEARRAYVVIPHLIIDNPGSDFYIQGEEVAPALIAIQFRIEKEYELSGFALLRAQELSTFFVVNYLEVRSLMEKLIERLKHELPDKFADIRKGRIVMLSAFGYFDPNTVLLDKPQICRLGPIDYERYATRLNESDVRKEFTRLLKDFNKDYIRIETKWCEKIEDYLKRAKYRQKGVMMQAIQELRRDLDKLEKDRGAGGHSITSEIRSKKGEAVNKFIEIIDRSFK